MKFLSKLIFAVCLLTCITACDNNAQTKKDTGSFMPLKARNGELAKSEEWPVVQQKAQGLNEKIAKDPSDLKSKLLLAQLYMQEARITGEHPYYYPATLTILDDVLSRDANNFEALAYKASVELSLHHFADALATGSKAKKINASNGFIFGVLCDANVELGNYDEAVKMSEQMQALRPGLESYSRASYLREIYGNNAAAIEAMKMAYNAGLPGSEEASWAGNTLAGLYESTGDLKNAENTYTQILTQRPSYAFAMAGLARVEKAKGNYDKALAMLDKAIAMMPEFSFYEDKADVYAAQGQPEKAKQMYTEVIGMLNEDAASGHYADMELAKAYLHTGNMDKALEHATIEYKRRPENIDANSTMGWVLYQKGEYAKAKEHMQKAVRMNTQNAELLCKAGIIEAAAGNKAKGTEWVKKAMKINPNMPEDLKAKAKTV
ncbi:MAG: tetratricopeptide repeat protein [Bacteroidota bacterium]